LGATIAAFSNMRDLGFQEISARPPLGKVSPLADRRAIVQRPVASIARHPLEGSIVPRPPRGPMASLQAAQRQQHAPKPSAPRRLRRSVNMPGHPRRRAPKVEGIVQQLMPRLPVLRDIQPNSMPGLRSTNTTSGSRFFRQQLEFFGSTRPVFA